MADASVPVLLFPFLLFQFKFPLFLRLPLCPAHSLTFRFQLLLPFPQKHKCPGECPGVCSTSISLLPISWSHFSFIQGVYLQIDQKKRPRSVQDA